MDAEQPLPIEYAVPGLQPDRRFPALAGEVKQIVGRNAAVASAADFTVHRPGWGRIGASLASKSGYKSKAWW